MPPTLGTQELEPVDRHPWAAALRGLRADALDCLQTTPALVADRAHGQGTHLALGCRWRFPARQADGTVRIPCSLQDRLAEAGELLGLRVGPPEGPLDASALRARLAGTGVLYVVADAYDLPWVPYAGHRHMSHGFLLAAAGDGGTVVDAYHNDTERGPARPGAWRLPGDSLERVLAGGALAIEVQPRAAPPALDADALRAGNAARARAAAADVEHYAQAVRAGLAQPEGRERLVLDIWLLGRERLLHSAWLADRRGAAVAAAEVAARAQDWQRLAAQSYLALRRARRGGPFNPAAVDDLVALLRADAELAARLSEVPAPRAAGAAPAAAPDPPRDPVTAAVLAALTVVLELDERDVVAAATLRDLPGFDSFRLVEVVERVERCLGVQLPDAVAADELRDADGLCRLFARAATAAAGQGR